MTHEAVCFGCRIVSVADERLGRSQSIRRSQQGFGCRRKILQVVTLFATNKYPRFVEFRENLPISTTGRF